METAIIIAIMIRIVVVIMIIIRNPGDGDEGSLIVGSHYHHHLNINHRVTISGAPWGSPGWMVSHGITWRIQARSTGYSYGGGLGHGGTARNHQCSSNFPWNHLIIGVTPMGKAPVICISHHLIDAKRIVSGDGAKESWKIIRKNRCFQHELSPARALGIPIISPNHPKSHGETRQFQCPGHVVRVDVMSALHRGHVFTWTSPISSLNVSKKNRPAIRSPKLQNPQNPPN